MTEKTADYDAIARLLSSASLDQVAKDVGLSRNSLYRYRRGEGKLRNMPLGDAIKLTAYARKFNEGENKDAFKL